MHGLSALWRLSLVLILTAPTAGCATLTSFLSDMGKGKPAVVVDTTCEVFGAEPDPLLPFIYHSTDAPDTKARARGVNRAYSSLCPDEPQGN